VKKTAAAVNRKNKRRVRSKKRRGKNAPSEINVWFFTLSVPKKRGLCKKRKTRQSMKDMEGERTAMTGAKDQ